jgi:hypothetical protein
MIEIPLATVRGSSYEQRYVALVDEEDRWVTQFNWFARRQRRVDGTALLWVYRRNGAAHVSMHREIWIKAHGAIPRGLTIDHVNREMGGLDNRRSNLRLATRKLQSENRGRCSSKSGYKGVSWHSRDMVWVAQIKSDRKPIWLGTFPDAEDAAKAYDTAARRLFGELAVVNFPQEAWT